MADRLVVIGVAAALGLTIACRSEAPKQETSETSATPAASSESHEGHQAMRVYFVEPKDGATVSSKTTTKFVFATDNYQISPVPKDAKEARPNMGHFHLGVDTDCLAPGTTIPKAEAGAKPGTAGQWIHFGTGSNNIEMALTPGDHKFAVEVGDDLHRAVEGMCQTISIKVE
jgi:uncharacterized protein DUF4399